ncbi:protein spindle-F [Culicoides brevitarsis]|uniref:protein spindle-F n=1 Tax=Culicoides brevitarsis TaxID=469753 RepID=UPI00307B3DF0
MEEQPKETYYALQVALKTLSERCEQMQSRIKVLEEENLELRTKCLSATSPTLDSIPDSIHSLQSEVVQLRQKNFELNQQKEQLAAHVEIVATENKQLWSRLSNITKNLNSNEDQDAKGPMSPSSHQNLIRSKTFTQNNPNPKLREKFKPNMEPEDLIIDVATFAIPDDATNEESSDTFKKLRETLLELKQEALKQNNILHETRTNLQEGKALQVCKKCASRSAMSEMCQKETADFVDVALNTTDHIDFLETKRKADAINSNDRICPMCGKCYAKDGVFEEFMEHVETHFLDIDDNMSLESLNIDEPFGFGSNIIHQF